MAADGEGGSYHLITNSVIQKQFGLVDSDVAANGRAILNYLIATFGAADLGRE
jgi:hypothetical protein